MKSACIISLRALLLGLSLGAFAVPSLSYADNSTHATESLSRASKAYEAGDYAGAYAAVEEAFKAGLSNDLAARAILLRAEINEKNGQLARALQDYSNALWMETLPPAERKTAQSGKERLIAAMGLSAPDSSRSTASSASGGAARSNEPSDSGSGFFGMFGGLFGSDERRPAQPPPAIPAQQSASTQVVAAAPTPAEKPAAAPKPRPSQTASASPSPKKSAPVQTAAAVQPASLNTHTSVAGGGFLIVFGTAPSEAAGKERARQIKAKLADILVSRELELEPGSAGALQIVAGPYKAKNSAVALCTAIKQRGIACQVSP